MIIDEQYIKSIIDSCNIKDFPPEKQGITIENDEVSDYLDMRINEIIKSTEETIEKEITKTKMLYEFQQVTSNNNVKKFVLMETLSVAIFNYIMDKYRDEKDIYKRVLGQIMMYSLELFESMLTSYVSNSAIPIGIMGKIILENFIVSSFIGEHPELAQPYSDHATLSGGIFFNDYEHSVTHSVEIEEILAKYDDSFKEKYGWTSKVIKNPQERTIETMEESVSHRNPFIKKYDFLKKFYYQFSYPSSFAVYYLEIQEGMKNIVTKACVKIITNNLIKTMEFYNSDKKDYVLIMNILYRLRKDLYNEPDFE
jgi:hypothetical protein